MNFEYTESELKAIAAENLLNANAEECFEAKQSYYEFVAKLETIAVKIDRLMYITDECIDRETVESRDKNTAEFWKQMKSAAYSAAQFRLEERGLNLYDLLIK